MKIHTPGKSLYWRITFSFLAILIILGLAYVMITVIATNRYYNETTQRLNSHVAESMLAEVSPFTGGKVNEESVSKIMHSMMAVNPTLEVYLLDQDGTILTFVVFDKKVKLSKIDLDPVHQFITNGGKKYILGDDPRNPGHKTIFSAAEVKENDQLQGYVYLVLASEQYENITSALLGSYWLRMGTNAFILTLLAAFTIGLVLIWFLTRNFRIIIRTFKRFEEGDLNARIPEERMKGELSTLSHTFNSMADTILRNIDSLKEVDTLRRELIANVSHDLRNPLAIIHGYIETLIIKEKDLSSTERAKYLQIILNGSEKLKRLVADLFELSKLETQQVRVDKEPFFINELVQDAVTNLKLLAERKNIIIESEISTSLPLVVADISMMERVIQNLMDNALHYTPEKGIITLKVSKVEDSVELDIRNTGEGIPEKDLPFIFNRYYKVNKEKSGIEGSGLGLAIVRKILDIQKIPIRVNSQPGKFTSFSLLIPVYS